VHYLPNTAAASPIKRTSRKVPLRYVVIGVTLYCAVAWSIVVVGVNAGMKALQKQPASYAASTAQTNR
jgi:hypothetical protein